MKFRSTLAFAMAFALSFGVVTTFTSFAFAQAPAQNPAVITLTTQTAVVTIIALLAGFIGQSINTGGLFGVITTPKAWVPYLTLAGSFLAAFGLSLQNASTLNGAAIFSAIVAGCMALTSAGAGSAVHSHLNSHKSSSGKAPAADGGGK
jgi:hypothetical protein